MELAEPAVTSAVYALADPPTARALLSRIRRETLELLASRAPLPPVLVDEAASSGDVELRTALLSATARRPSLFDRLAARGDPELALELYECGNCSDADRRRRIKVWQGAAATTGSPGWRAPDGLVSRLLADGRPDLLRPALHSPFPDLVRHALTRLRGTLRADDELCACRTVLAHGGVPAVREVLQAPAVSAQVAERVRAACAAADPDAALAAAIDQERVAHRAALARPTVRQPAADVVVPRSAPATGTRQVPHGFPSGQAGDTAPARTARTARTKAPAPAPSVTDVLIGKLRNAYHTDVLAQLERSGVPDWDALRAAHREQPFPFASLRALWERPDCPEELAVEAFVHGYGPPVGALHWRMLTVADSCVEDTLPKILPSGMASGVFPVPRVVAEVGPARKVLGALPHDDGRVRAALATQVARLGADFAPWRALYTLLPRFPGTVPDLVDAALEAAPKHRGKTWPKPLGAEFPSRDGGLGRRAWLHLFDRAEPATQRALAGYLDGRTVQYLLLHHEPSAELREDLVELHGAGALAGLASHWKTPPEVVVDLLRHDDPGVNAALFLYCDLTDAQRRHVLAGRRTGAVAGAGTATEDRLPLTDALVEGLKESSRRSWLLPVADSGDPLLCRVLLGSPRVKLHTAAQYLLMLVRLWERHGPREVESLLDETVFPGRRKPGRNPLPREIVRTARRALAADDGLAELCTAQAGAAGPEGLADHLRTHGYGTDGNELTWALDLWAEENGPATVPWPHMVAAHRSAPLNDRLLTALAELVDCPAELTEAAGDARLRLSHDHYTPRRGSRPPTAPELLRKLPLPVGYGGRSDWLSGACRTGRLTLPEILRHGFPAQASAAFFGATLATLQDDGPAGPSTDDVRRIRAALAALVRTHLGDDPEGWAVALRLMPDFQGTLPELLATAGAVIS